MKVIEPVRLTDAMLIASTVAEDDYPVWSVEATYARGARVISTETHRVYESAIDGNVGSDPVATAGSQWIDLTATNRWAMFDEAAGSATTATGSITVTLEPGTVDALAVIDTDAVSVRVRAVGGDYDETRAVEDGRTSVVFDDLPAATRLSVTIDGPNPGLPVAVGTLLVGAMVDLGLTEAGPSIGINDYSKRATDEFGVTTVTERAWAKRMTIRSMIATADVDAIQLRLAGLRARPALWIGEDGFDALSIYGFFKDFSIDLALESISYCSLTIEGLTTAGALENGGSGTAIIFCNAVNRPPTPARGAGLVPFGWTAEPQDLAEGEYRWWCQAEFRSGIQISNWTTPVKVAGTSWQDIADDDPAHPKPADGATVGAPPGTPVGNKLAEEIAEGVDQALYDINELLVDVDELREALGDTASAALSAAAAEAAKLAAENAKTAAEGSASASAGSASIASAAADAAGGSASAAAASVLQASNLAGNAAASATSAQTAATTASDKAAAASQSAQLAATFSGGGGNLLLNTDFGIDASGWTFVQDNAPTGSGGRDQEGDDWRPKGEHVLSIAHNIADQGRGKWSIWDGAPVAIEALKWYEFSAWLAMHRCAVQLQIIWLSAADVEISPIAASTISATGEFAGGTALNGYGRKYVKAQAPTGAARAKVRFVKYAGEVAGQDSYAWMCRPQLRETLEATPSPLMYSPGKPTGQNAGLKATIDSTAQAVATAQGAIATVEQRLTAGNPNLLPNGGFEKGLTGWTAGGSSVWDIANANGWGPYAYTVTNGTYWLQSDKFPVLPGGQYTIAADIQFQASGGNAYVDLVYYDAAGVVVPDGDGPQVLRPPGTVFTSDGSGRRASAVTATAPTNATQAVARFVIQSGAGVTLARVRQIKVERGSVATAYSAEASLTQQGGVLNTVEGKTQSYWQLVANAGASTAFAQIRADGYSSTIAFGGYEFHVFSPTGSQWKKALSVVGGDVIITGKLNVSGGIVSSPDGRTNFDLNSNRIIFNNGTIMKVTGVGFGSSNQFMEWVGPSFSSLSSCTEANAIQYIKVNGDAYFSGSLSAGILKTAVGTSSLAANASVETGLFGSNGGSIKVVLSYSWSETRTKTYAADSTGVSQWNADVASFGGSGSPGTFFGTRANPGTASIQLDRASGGGAFSYATTLNINGGTDTMQGLRPFPGDAAGNATFTTTFTGSLTFTDPQFAAVDRNYRATIISRFSPAGGTAQQRITIVATE